MIMKFPFKSMSHGILNCIDYFSLRCYLSTTEKVFSVYTIHELDEIQKQKIKKAKIKKTIM